MRVRTLEIRWHDSKPISTCDFQPVPFKKARPAQDKNFAGQSYRLATGGEDNHVRMWMVYPNILPQSVVDGASTSAPAPRPPRVEYLATLNRHSAAVNVVRWSPNGELVASAGDDGMIIVWALTNSPQSTTYGIELGTDDLQYEKEHWKPRVTFRCTTMQVYDLAWSPTGEYILAGSTDNCARIFTASEGKCVHEIAEHSHYVQGVAWDPLNEYIATQSSDRSMHVYSISHKQGTLEVHAVGKNARLPYRHHRTGSSHSRSRPHRSESIASETESVLTSLSEHFKEDSQSSAGHQYNSSALLTPTASVPSTPSTTMFPPPLIERPSSRRSSFSGSNAPSSPANHSRYGRSPSPMPALPAIRVPPSASATWGSVKLYGDENYTNFFRRLTFSPDGGLLLTPAGHFEDPSIDPTQSNKEDTPARGRKGNFSPVDTTKENNSSVYIYSRANFARPPIACLPAHKKASIAVRFSLIMYELRSGVPSSESVGDPKIVTLEKGRDEVVDVDIGGGTLTPASSQSQEPPSAMSSPIKLTPSTGPNAPIAAPSPRIAIPTGPPSLLIPSPALSATDSLRPPTPLASKPATPAMPPVSTASIFALPYRMLYAVATMDTVAIYDTQQSGPVCLLTKLHYDEFTDMSWSPDGQCLMLSSRDGYCTIVVFDEILPTYHTQQQTLQLQSIAHHNSLPLSSSSVSAIATPLSTPSNNTVALPIASPAQTPSVVPMKRPAVEPPLTPAASVDESVVGGKGVGEESSGGTGAGASAGPSGLPAESERDREPPKKKRRAVLTRVGDVNS